MALLNLNTSVSGRVEHIKILRDGVVVREMDGFDNLVLDAGLTYLSGGNLIYNGWNYCHFGQGTAPPAPTDTSLTDRITQLTTGYMGNIVVTTEWPTVTHTFKFRTPIATQNYNLTELGLSAQNRHYELRSRTLIKDTQGEPSALTLLVGEQIELTYSLILRYSENLSVFTLTNTGNKGGSYTFRVGLCYTPANMSPSRVFVNANIDNQANWNSNARNTLITGDIPVEWIPSNQYQPPISGNQSGVGSYSGNKVNFPTTYGFKCTGIVIKGECNTLITIDPPIDKSNLETLSFTLKFNVTRS